MKLDTPCELCDDDVGVAAPRLPVLLAGELVDDEVDVNPGSVAMLGDELKDSDVDVAAWEVAVVIAELAESVALVSFKNCPK
ncbi:hypothetical protein MMC07_006657 [Pseudocyphellaria aurata]|nr:hypothetical protein [Pseudocyphellaria aurata]